MKRFQEIMTNLETIKSLAKVKLFNTYVITNRSYSLIKPTTGNRGGVDNGRVKYYFDAIRNDKFDFDLSVVQIDKKGNIVEGHHRVIAIMQAELPVVVRIVPFKNLTEISIFNSGPNSKWKPEETFGAAKTAGSLLAKFADEYRDKVCEKFIINKTKISACEIYGILTKDVKRFGAGKNAATVDMWMNKQLYFDAIEAKSDFKKNMKLYAEMKSLLKSIRDSYKVCKGAMDLHFNNHVDFELSIFVDALRYDGFAMENYSAAPIRAKALAMYQKQAKLKVA